MSTKSISIVYSANTLSTQAQSVVTITGRTVYGRVVSATTAVVQAAVAVNPSIQWNSQTMTVGAYKQGDPEDPIPIHPGFTYNDITAITATVVSGDTSKISVESIDSAQTPCEVTLEVEPNTSEYERSFTVRLTGRGSDGNNYTSDLVITQEAFEPSLTIEGSNHYVMPSGTSVCAFTRDFEVYWNDIDTDTLGFSGATGNFSWGGWVSGTGKHEFTATLSENTQFSEVVSQIIITATTVLGTSINAILEIKQGPASQVTTSITWEYRVHFFGTHSEREVINFTLQRSGNTYGTATIDEDGLSIRTVGDTFSGTTTVTVPVSLVSSLVVTDNRNFSLSYYEYSRTSNKIISTLYVPSQTNINVDIIAQAFRGFEGGGAAFPIKFTVQTLTPEQTQYGPTSALTTSVSNVGPARPDVIHTTASYTSSSWIDDFQTRMGCWLEFRVDTGYTGSFTDLLVESEDGNDIISFPVTAVNESVYWIFLGDIRVNVEDKTLYVKFVDADGYDFQVSTSSPILAIQNDTDSAVTVGGFQLFAQTFSEGGNNHVQYMTSVQVPAHSSRTVTTIRTRELTQHAIGMWANWNVTGVSSGTPIKAQIVGYIISNTDTSGAVALTRRVEIGPGTGSMVLMIGNN